MYSRIAWLITLLSLFVASCFAQGLDTRQTKDDWEEINFEFNSATLSDGYPSLLRLAELLKTNPGYKVRVEGHTDNLGSNRYNEKLGQARANTVRDFLVKYGANASQIETATHGKGQPEASGYKRRYSKTDVARWMNRRVVLTVMDESGKTVSAGGVGSAISALDKLAAEQKKCCDDILKRLDKLDDIAKMLKDMADQNAALRNQVNDLKTQQQALESRINALPKPLSEEQTAGVVDTRLERFRDPRFSLLGLNIGADGNRDVTFSGKGRFFAPFKDHFAVQIQGEYMYFRTQREGQMDIGLVNRIGNFQGSIFGSFKHVTLRETRSGGTLGQAAATMEYIFPLGKVGIFGTKGFMDNAILDRRNAMVVTGTNPDGTALLSAAPNLFRERYLHIVDQIGLNTTLGLFGPAYLEGNLGYLRSFGHADRPGGTLRFVFPVADRFAFTVEGGVNETLLTRNNNGRAVVGIQWGNFLRPRDFQASRYPVPVDVPRVRYEVLTRNVRSGSTPPVADAGPDQIGLPAGTVTLNGSRSYDPNGEQLTYQWVQETGPSVALSGATTPIATFQSQAGQAYSFRLTVTNTSGLQGSARTRVSTRAEERVQILFFNANPQSIPVGQASTLTYRVLNATEVTIEPGIGRVNPMNGSLSVSPTETTTYRLTARNPNSSENSTVTVTVQRPEARIVSCTASPMNITAGQSATLFFATENAENVSISGGVGTVANSGSVVVNPTQTTTYVVTAGNRFGSTTCSVTVQVTPGTAPRVVRFTAAPTTISQGATSTLVFQVENATDVSIDNGVGTVTPVGTADVKPTQNTTYTLTAKNQFGQVTAQASVTVTAAPAATAPSIVSFTANPPVSPSPGSPVVLSCVARNATTVAVSGAGQLDQNGNVTVQPQTDTTYTCTASGTGTPATATVTVKVTQPTVPPVVVIGTLGGATCTGGSVVGGSVTTSCQTVVRQVKLDLTQSSSPSGSTPLTFLTTSRSNQAAVLDPTSPTPTVQIAGLFGDYFFDVVATDSKGNQSTGTVVVSYVVTRP